MSKPVSQSIPAPEISASHWFNTANPLTLMGLRGRPVLLHAFQMLCPGCVAHGTPQAEKAHRLFGGTDLQVIGLHSVFEHHDAMTPTALKAFIHEYRLTMPIAVDEAGGEGGLPVTMRRFRMRGTPTSILIGRDGTVLHHGFGQEDDMALGALISSALAGEIGDATTEPEPAGESAAADGCTADGCTITA